MTLTPTLKFALIAIAFTINIALLAWTNIETEAIALGMREEVFSIGVKVLTTLNAGGGALLVYLGIKAPTIEKPDRAQDHL